MSCCKERARKKIGSFRGSRRWAGGKKKQWIVTKILGIKKQACEKICISIKQNKCAELNIRNHSKYYQVESRRQKIKKGKEVLFTSFIVLFIQQATHSPLNTPSCLNNPLLLLDQHMSPIFLYSLLYLVG